jgi:hypothetical protein
MLSPDHPGLPSARAGVTIRTNWPACMPCCDRGEHMIPTEAPSTGGAPRGCPGPRSHGSGSHGSGSHGSGSHSPWSHKRATIVVLAFLLAAAVVSVASPATSTAAKLASAALVTYPDPSSCRGEKPGVCPYYYPDYPNRQDSAQPDPQYATLPSSTS